MSQLTERNRTGDFLLTEVDPLLCRQTVTVTGGHYESGAVLSLTAEGKYGETAVASGEHCVLMRRCDASISDQDAVVFMRLCGLKPDHLEWKQGISAEHKATVISDMKDQHLIVVGE